MQLSIGEDQPFENEMNNFMGPFNIYFFFKVLVLTELSNI